MHRDRSAHHGVPVLDVQPVQTPRPAVGNHCPKDLSALPQPGVRADGGHVSSKHSVQRETEREREREGSTKEKNGGFTFQLLLFYLSPGSRTMLLFSNVV